MKSQASEILKIKLAFEIELKSERKQITGCKCCRGYIDYNTPCPDCFLGDLVENWMYWTSEYHKEVYG